MKVHLSNTHNITLVSPMGKWAIVGLKGLTGDDLTKLRTKLDGLVFNTITEDKFTTLTPTQQHAVSLIKSKVRTCQE